MKRTVTLILGALAVLTMNAQRRPLRAMADMDILCQTEGVTVVGHQQGGYAIVANDAAAPEVLGYSDGIFDLKANPALAWYVGAASQTIARLKAMGKSYAPLIPEGNFKTEIAPLIATQWAQGTPYNKQCPMLSGRTPYPTGCVATAMAQIMNFWKYPEQGQGEATLSVAVDGKGAIISADFSQATYKWDLMLNDYPSGEYTDEQADAVAQLMLHCGIGAGMSYSPSGSGTQSYQARIALAKYFKYNPNIDILHRNYFSLEQWMNILYTEFNEGRPVYYAAQDAKGGSGHAFIIDGYDADGLVHVNWGWGPDQGNGYYDIALLNVGNAQYSISQEVLTHIAPTAINDFHSHIVCYGGISCSLFGKNLRFAVDQLYNFTGEKVSGETALVLEREGKKYLLKTQAFKETAHYATVESALDGLYTQMPAGIPDGEYLLYVAAKTPKDADWRPVHTLEGRGNHATLVIAAGVPTKVETYASDTWTGIGLPAAEDAAATDALTRVYDGTGRLVYTSPTPQFNLWSVPARGLLIVKQGDSTRKVVR